MGIGNAGAVTMTKRPAHSPGCSVSNDKETLCLRFKAFGLTNRSEWHAAYGSCEILQH